MKEFIRKSIKKWLGDVPPFPDEDEMVSMVDMVGFCIREWCKLLVAPLPKKYTCQGCFRFFRLSDVEPCTWMGERLSDTPTHCPLCGIEWEEEVVSMPELRRQATGELEMGVDYSMLGVSIVPPEDIIPPGFKEVSYED